MILNERCQLCGGELVIQSHQQAGCIECGSVTPYSRYTDEDDVLQERQARKPADRREVFFNGEYTTFE